MQTREGTILVSYGSHGMVELDDGERLDCQYRRQVGRPFCGDRVRVQLLPDGQGVVEVIRPRRNHFVRADSQGRQHIVAANLDRVMIVIAHKPLPSGDLLERYLVAVHSLDIEPVIVVNKVDLQTRESKGARARVLSRLDAYRALGYAVAETSCKSAPGVAALVPLLREGTAILVGQSGVGKSSLVRTLLPDLDIQTGALSEATGKGTHTTTTTIRYPLPEGGFLIDSPGVWEYGLWRLEDAEIAHGFVEFRPFLGECRFSDCRHDSEPNCAVKQAVQAEAIASWRYEAYRRLLSQNRGAPA